ncbi:MAG TPA: hypothetical protein VHE37_13105, partial [Nevskiaceae bacterium]|nr:hypothetical protein [Nevskiaceae bacterium]
MNVISARWISGLMLVSAAVPVWACSSCGCTLGTEWADAGFSAAPGLRVDLRYDLINQSRLRHGTHGASADDVAAALADGSAEETQVSTFTRFYTLGL